MVPRLWFGPLHFFFISWRSKQVNTCAPAGDTGYYYYFLSCLYIGFPVPGLQRFNLGQIGMGILYFFTAGVCFIGTIVEIVNYRTLALEYNQKMAYESYHIAKMSN